jgi:hypothetical protein
MTTYADPELLISTWLHTRGHLVRADPHLRSDSWTRAPITHIQRTPGYGGLALTLDDPLLDFDTYAGQAATARDESNALWAVMTLELPKTTLPGGIFVMKVDATPPCWAPATNGAYRRTAAYRVILHGLIS